MENSLFMFDIIRLFHFFVDGKWNVSKTLLKMCLIREKKNFMKNKIFSEF